MNPQQRTPGITAMAAFFWFGACMSGLAGLMLLFPGSILDPLWRLNPRAQEGFAGMGGWAVLLMVVVCVACATAARGLWRCKRWGLWTVLAILTVNLAGDTANSVVAHDARTLIGLPIGGLMIFYLVRKRPLFTGGRGV
jgi:hypothetical protein